MIVRIRRLDLSFLFSLNFVRLLLFVYLPLLQLNYKKYLVILIMISNRKLTYNKVYVDSQKRLPQSESSSDFIMQMNENLETHPNTVM